MLHLSISNRSEVLAEALAARMRAAPLSLFETEPVVVPSTAVARWLEFRLADRLGIATRIEFAFAAAYVWRLFGRVLPDVGPTSPFDRTVMQWRLARLLGASRAEPVRRYLAGDDGRKQVELAARLAALFDRYLVERPDWIAAWNAGRTLGLGADEAWQAALWRALCGELTDVAATHPRERFFAHLRDDPTARARLPRRIALFAVEAMPAMYWESFVALGEWVDVHVCVLAPSREYWGDIEREKERRRLEIRQPEAAVLFESGHPLLASLGRARRPVAVRLAETPFASEDERFVPPPATLLGRLQADLLDLTESRGLAPDASVEVHACHGALREAEVLHDRLLALFEALPGLMPADILILTPDIETYGPLVEAVLTHAPPGRRIPCALADRALAQLPCWRALRRVCAAAGGELDAESVLAPLEEPAVRRAFAIAEGELVQLRDWVATAGIRWGVDAADRARRGLPAEAAHTWRAGIARLLHGVALPDAERLCGDVLPLPGVEGARAELLGRFLDYVEAVFEFSAKVDKTAPEWAETLAAAFERFVAPEEGEEGEAQRVRAALAELAAQLRETACDVRLPLAVVLRELDAALATQAPARAFASGSATIAALVPGRPLPARVLCLVGMNEGAFPGSSGALHFDLIARHPRFGDRERRGEERYAFLETLLCATDALIVTYAGRDPRGDTEYPPAAPLAELIDTLAAMTGRPADALIVRQPLQPFSPACFDGERPELASHDVEHCAAAVAAFAPRAAPAFLAPGVSLPLEGAAADDLAPEDLHRFFSHPLRHFLRERLGIHLEAGETLLERHEPFVADRRLEYRLRAAFFEGWRAGRPEEETARLLAARGELPHGAAGALACRKAQEEAAPLWEAARPWLDAAALPPMPFGFSAHGATLSGALEGASAAGLWRVRPGRIRGVDRLCLWIDHLLLHVAAPEGVPRQSALIAPEGVLRLSPLTDADERLADLLALWRAGQTQPLFFFVETAWAWVAEDNWERVWYGDRHRKVPGERDDAWIRLALTDATDDPLGPAFRELAARVFAPLAVASKVGDG